MEISSINTDLYFAFFYTLSFVVPAILILLVGIKRKYNLNFLLLTLVTITVFTVIGSRLFTIPIEEWKSVFNLNLGIYYNSRSAIGALLFGFIALVISQKIFGFKKPILDVYAFTTPIGLGIQKIGCFFMGCCYGNITDSVFGVNYMKGSHVHFDHWMSNLIEENALSSLNIHPVQLYETVGLFIIAFIIWKTREFWKKNGSSVLFGIALLMIFRFSIEFVRDAASSPFNNFYLLGIRSFQWALLSVGIICGILLLIYEKYLKINLFQKQKSFINLNHSIHFILIISLIIYVFQELFTVYEFSVIIIELIPAIIITSVVVFKQNVLIKNRLVGSMLLVIPFILISQSVPKKLDSIKKYKRVAIGTSFGNFEGDIAYNPQEGECGTSYTHEDYQYKYTVGGGGFALVSKKGKATTTYGLNLHAGSNKETNLETGIEKSFFVFGVNPYASYNTKWIGVGGGAQFGNLRWIPSRPSDDSTFEDGMKTSPVLPEFYFRVGPRHILDIKYAYGFNFPSPLPAQTQEFSIGSGVSLKEDYSLRFGVLMAPNAKFVSAEGLINDQFGFNISYIFDTEGIGGGEVDSNTRLVFALNYRFDFENK